jgi:hypothetical protein
VSTLQPAATAGGGLPAARMARATSCKFRVMAHTVDRRNRLPLEFLHLGGQCDWNSVVYQGTASAVPQNLEENAGL